MKSIKNQYIDLQEGRISQTYFMRNMRMSLPQYITNVTSFKDTVKILKNKGILSEADIKYKDGKDMYAQFNEIDNLNGQEVLAGTAIEHSCYPDKTKDEILKMVVKNLKKNPFYYTDYKLSGIAGAEPTTGDNTKPADNQMKLVAKDNAVDKALGMKAVKGFENAKASANKASKETNKGENIEMMTLIAKTVRGLVKMDATGEKIKKIIVKEAQEVAQTFDDHEEWMAAVKAAYPKADYTKGSNKWKTQTGEIDVPYEKFFQGFQELGSWDEKTGTGKLYKAQDISANVYPAGSRMDEADVDTLSQAKQYFVSNPTLKLANIKLEKIGDDIKFSYDGELPADIKAAIEKQFTISGNTLSPKHTTPEVGVGLQSPMEEMIRKIVREMFDGMEPMDRTGMDA